MSSPSERGAVAAARPDLPSLAPAPACPVAVVRTPQGWTVIWPEGEDPVGSLVEGLWQFPQDKPVSEDDFAMTGFFMHRCSNPFGCR